MLIADSAYPQASYPASWNGQPIVGWGFYIGGNTPHRWSAAEVAVLKAHYRYLLPIYTCSNPGGRNAAADAAAAIAALHALGVPSGVLVQLDYETAVDSAYEQEFGRLLAAAGYILELYGSAATVARNVRPAGGFDEASWTGKDAAPSDTGLQFVDVGPYDLNDFRPSAPLWDTRPPVQALTPAAVAASTEEDEMAQAQNGYATFSWSQGERHVVQVAFDTIGGNQPVLRAVLLLTSGPLVLAEAWKPDHTEAGKVVRFTEHQADAYGLELQPVGTPARYAANVS